MMNLLDAMWAAFDRHKLARRLTLAWACALITWVCARVFSDVKNITEPVAHALEIVVGILTVVIGFYQWSRHRESGQDKGGA